MSRRFWRQGGMWCAGWILGDFWLTLSHGRDMTCLDVGQEARMTCEHCDHIRRENLAILKHEAETPMRGHDEDGRCCLLVRIAAQSEHEEDA